MMGGEIFDSLSVLGEDATNSVNGDGERLSTRSRNYQGNNPPLEEFHKEISKIGIFSREAFGKLGEEYKERISEVDGGLPLDRSSLKKFSGSAEQIEILRGKQSVTEQDSAENQFSATFSGKNIPHVVAVIEGRALAAEISTTHTLAGQEVTPSFTKVEFHLGKRNNGGSDARQNVTFYVRNDLKDAYHIGQRNINVPGYGDYNVGVVSFKTFDPDTEKNSNFETLVVHIPHLFVGNNSKEEATHQALLNYAESRKGSGVIVTGYIGDTNYKSEIQPNSVPSVGGHGTKTLADGVSKETLNPKGNSSKKKDRPFIQHVALDTSGESITFQPSTVNLALPTSKEDGSIDHPSIEGYTAVSGRIVKRNPGGFPDNYPGLGVAEGEGSLKPSPTKKAKPTLAFP